MPVALDAAPISTLLSDSTPVPWASKTPALSAGLATALHCVSVPAGERAQGAVVLELRRRPTSEPETSVTPPGSVRSRFRPRAPKIATPTLPVTCSNPAFSTVPGVLIWTVPADHVVVPFSRSVWPAAKKSTVSVIVVCEPALKAVVPASAKLLGPSDDWPLPTVSVPSPRRVPSPAMRSAPVLPSSSKSSMPPFRAR